MRANDVGSALATHEPCRHENPSVGPIEIRTRRTDNFTPILACDSNISF